MISIGCRFINNILVWICISLLFVVQDNIISSEEQDEFCSKHILYINNESSHLIIVLHN